MNSVLTITNNTDMFPIRIIFVGNFVNSITTTIPKKQQKYTPTEVIEIMFGCFKYGRIIFCKGDIKNKYNRHNRTVSGLMKKSKDFNIYGHDKGELTDYPDLISFFNEDNNLIYDVSDQQLYNYAGLVNDISILGDYLQTLSDTTTVSLSDIITDIILLRSDGDITPPQKPVLDQQLRLLLSSLFRTSPFIPEKFTQHSNNTPAQIQQQQQQQNNVSATAPVSVTAPLVSVPGSATTLQLQHNYQTPLHQHGQHPQQEQQIQQHPHQQNQTCVNNGSVTAPVSVNTSATTVQPHPQSQQLQLQQHVQHQQQILQQHPHQQNQTYVNNGSVTSPVSVNTSATTVQPHPQPQQLQQLQLHGQHQQQQHGPDAMPNLSMNDIEEIFFDGEADFTFEKSNTNTAVTSKFSSSKLDSNRSEDVTCNYTIGPELVTIGGGGGVVTPLIPTNLETKFASALTNEFVGKLFHEVSFPIHNLKPEHNEYIDKLYVQGKLRSYLAAFMSTIMPTLDENSNSPLLIKASMRKYIQGLQLHPPTQRSGAFGNNDTNKRKNDSLHSNYRKRRYNIQNHNSQQQHLPQQQQQHQLQRGIMINQDPTYRQHQRHHHSHPQSGMNCSQLLPPQSRYNVGSLPVPQQNHNNRIVAPPPPSYLPPPLGRGGYDHDHRSISFGNPHIGHMDHLRYTHNNNNHNNGNLGEDSYQVHDTFGPDTFQISYNGPDSNHYNGNGEYAYQPQSAVGMDGGIYRGGNTSSHGQTANQYHEQYLAGVQYHHGQGQGDRTVQNYNYNNSHGQNNHSQGGGTNQGVGHNVFHYGSGRSSW